MPRVLLIQVRGQPAARAQEELCFLEAAGLRADELDCVNLIEEPRVEWERATAADAVLIGGAGAHSATEDYPFSEALDALVRRLVSAGRPLLGSCWGHHVLARALGGTVVTDPARRELGTYDVDLTAEGAADPLLTELPRRFPAHLGHHDRVATLPPGVEELAFSARCRNQAIRVAGRPAYGFQFHTELDEARMRERLAMYWNAYVTDGAVAEEFERLLRPTPEVGTILRRFLALYAAPRPSASCGSMP